MKKHAEIYILIETMKSYTKSGIEINFFWPLANF